MMPDGWDSLWDRAATDGGGRAQDGTSPEPASMASSAAEICSA